MMYTERLWTWMDRVCGIFLLAAQAKAFISLVRNILGNTINLHESVCSKSIIESHVFTLLQQNVLVWLFWWNTSFDLKLFWVRLTCSCYFCIELSIFLRLIGFFRENTRTKQCENKRENISSTILLCSNNKAIFRWRTQCIHPWFWHMLRFGRIKFVLL